jgi:hypothetical protein
MWNLGLRHPNRFVVGANLPWIGYGTDFGASLWYPEGGLSARPAALARLEETLAALERDGIPIVRVFVLCDGRSGIQFDAAGLPAGLDPMFFPDMDALMAAARRHDVRVMPTLLDFHVCGPPQVVNGVLVGGRTHLIAEPSGRAALIDRVLKPILRRYGDDEIVAAWDVMNEPEWCLKRMPGVRRASRFVILQEFLRQTVEAVRASARQPVTVGCAGLWRLDLVKPLGLDFYQVHWYERFGWSALERPVASLGLDRPVILGEFSGRAARWAVAEVLDAAQRAGYQGALVWSILSEDDQSGYTPDIVSWIRAHGPAPEAPENG